MTHHAGAGSGDGSPRISSIMPFLIAVVTISVSHQVRLALFYDTQRGDEGMNLPRGKYIGTRVGQPATDEAEHFIKCPGCGGWIDCRDLAQVFEHEGPLPHPAQDRPQ